MNIKKVAITAAAAYGVYWAYMKFLSPTSAKINTTSSTSITDANGSRNPFVNFSSYMRNYFSVGN